MSEISIKFREGEPALNVKSYVTRDAFERMAPGFGRHADALGDGRVEGLWSNAVEGFWRDASEVATEFGYGEAMAEGRSGGWLVVTQAPELEEEPDPACDACGHVLLTEIDGGERERCDDCGHVQPNPCHARRLQWVEFAKRIGSLQEFYEREFAASVVADGEDVESMDPSITKLGEWLERIARDPDELRILSDRMNALEQAFDGPSNDEEHDAASDLLAALTPPA